MIFHWCTLRDKGSIDVVASAQLIIASTIDPKAAAALFPSQ